MLTWKFGTCAILAAGVIFGQDSVSLAGHTRDVNVVACSADGSKLVLVANGGQIYTSSQGGTTTGTTGYLSGARLTAVELEYVGNNIFIPLSHEGTIRAY